MIATPDWAPTNSDPLFILAMDHRASFGTTLFGVEHDEPSESQLAAMRQAKNLIYAGLTRAASSVSSGRPGVLVDEALGAEIIEQARHSRIVLACPIEASGHEWFTLEYGTDWLAHVRAQDPDYVKVLVRDNPSFDPAAREGQFTALREVSSALHGAGYPLLYELLVPAAEDQLAAVGGDSLRYDVEIRPELVTRVIADNYAHDIEPTLWKVEGLETVEAAQLVARAARAGGRAADLIVLGRDAPRDRLDHWLDVATQVEQFVGFAIGRSIWEDAVRDYEASMGNAADRDRMTAQVSERYLGFVARWRR